MTDQTQYFFFTYRDLQELTGLTRAGVSQHVCRGNLDATNLVSVAAFIARYGKPEVRIEIMERMMGINRQLIDRSRPQSSVVDTNNSETQQVAEAKPNYRKPKPKPQK